MLRDQLPEVRHFLKELWEEKGVVRVVALQVESEHMHNALLHFLNVSYVEKARTICSQEKREMFEYDHHLLTAHHQPGEPTLLPHVAFLEKPEQPSDASLPKEGGFSHVTRPNKERQD